MGSSSEWYRQNIESARAANTERNRAWRARQGEGYTEYQRLAKRRRRSDPSKRLADNLRARIYGALCGRRKEAHLHELIGCPIPELMTHLEGQFQPGMSWENYGQWHVDHRRALDSFDLEDPVQLFEAMNFRNLQPLWAGENIRKGSR